MRGAVLMCLLVVVAVVSVEALPPPVAPVVPIIGPPAAVSAFLPPAAQAFIPSADQIKALNALHTTTAAPAPATPAAA
ncbi:hypothetical protein Pcinc_016343 [Petrolisthes cinctipes]|uniref:Uncharacterized protein n=1 Tax=Petrolisthes cinctipes TaxID=88211 RepID=A0AAE1FRI7_PETCI|nr:hypothetical protein Pcinc_016343 [Petrolisthes cinctipes]